MKVTKHEENRNVKCSIYPHTYLCQIPMYLEHISAVRPPVKHVMSRPNSSR